MSADNDMIPVNEGLALAHYVLHSGPYPHPRGDASFFEETLYQYRGSLYLHGRGGHISPYRRLMDDGCYGDGEQVIHMTEREAQLWRADRFGTHPDLPIDRVEVAP